MASGPAAIAIDSSDVQPHIDASDVIPHGEKSLGEHVADAAKSFWETVNPLTIAKSLNAVVSDPKAAAKEYGEQTGKILQNAKDAWGRGDHASAIAHGVNYLLNGIPGLGATLDQAQIESEAGDVGSALGRTAGIAALGEVPKVPGAVSAGMDAAKSVATSPALIKGVGAGLGAAAGHATGVPTGGLIGAYIGKEIGSSIAERVNKTAPVIAPSAETARPIPAVDASTGEVLKWKPLANGEFASPGSKIRLVKPSDVQPDPVRPATPAPVQEGSPARPSPGQPIGVDEPQGIHGGQENTPIKSVDDWLEDLRSRMEKRGIKFDTGNPQARFDEGSGAPIIKSELRKSGATGEPANPQRTKSITLDPTSAAAKAVVENPDSPLARAALAFAKELSKGKKTVSVSDLMGGLK